MPECRIVRHPAIRHPAIRHPANDADAGTGPFTGIRWLSYRYRNSLLTNWNIRCWNADFGSISFGADAQVCPMPTTVQGGAESLKGSHSMENKRNSLKTSAPYPLRKTWLSVSLSVKSISLDITFKKAVFCKLQHKLQRKFLGRD